MGVNGALRVALASPGFSQGIWWRLHDRGSKRRVGKLRPGRRQLSLLCRCERDKDTLHSPHFHIPVLGWTLGLPHSWHSHSPRAWPETGLEFSGNWL